jgi:hypothetical protein
LVSRLVGHTDYCGPVENSIPDQDKTDEDRRALKAAAAIAHNSCALQDIEKVLSSR